MGNANNPVLVLVHGYPDNQEVWEPVIGHLVQDYYIVTYDVRGAGMSSVPRRTRAYACLLYTSPSPRDRTRSRMPSSA